MARDFDDCRERECSEKVTNRVFAKAFAEICVELAVELEVSVKACGIPMVKRVTAGPCFECEDKKDC